MSDPNPALTIVAPTMNFHSGLTRKLPKNLDYFMRMMESDYLLDCIIVGIDSTNEDQFVVNVYEAGYGKPPTIVNVPAYAMNGTDGYGINSPCKGMYKEGTIYLFAGPHLFYLLVSFDPYTPSLTTAPTPPTNPTTQSDSNLYIYPDNAAYYFNGTSPFGTSPPTGVGTAPAPMFGIGSSAPNPDKIQGWPCDCNGACDGSLLQMANVIIISLGTPNQLNTYITANTILCLRYPNPVGGTVIGTALLGGQYIGFGLKYQVFQTMDDSGTTGFDWVRAAPG